MCFLENPKDLKRYHPITDRHGGEHQFKITGTIKQHIIIKIDGVDDRNAAEALRGLELFAPTSQLPPKQEDEFFIEELVGLDTRDAAGKTYGKVSAIHNFGAGDILEISGGEELLLPFKEPFIIEVGKDHILITPPEYLEADND